MCTETIQTYARCGCRKIKITICRKHINHTHTQKDNRPCPHGTSEILDSLQGSRVGTRNHPGPCPKVITTYAFQTVREAEREAEEKRGLWSKREVMARRREEEGGLWKWKGVMERTVSMDVAVGGGNGLRVDGDEDMGLDGMGGVQDEVGLKTLDAHLTEESKGKGKKNEWARSGPVDDVEVPSGWELNDGSRMSSREMLDQRREAEKYWKRRKY